jgi:hypothetical protein
MSGLAAAADDGSDFPDGLGECRQDTGLGSDLGG